jgi:hypothetical protein
MHQDKSLMLKTDTAISLKDLLDTLLPAENIYIPVVKKEQQLKQLELLHETISNETFYFVFNLLTCELENVLGVERWLGYSNREFTLSHYLDCINPAQSIQFNMIARCMYQSLCKSTFKLRFSTQRYISLVALKHYNGEYIVFKKTTSVFQYDDKNRLLAQLNEFNKIGIYDGTPLMPRIFEMDGFQKNDFEQMVFKMAMESFMEKKFFSDKEFTILKYYALNDTCNSKDLANLLNVKVSTIDTFNKRILDKARHTFTHPFSNAREVALYLKKERILV